MCGIAGILNLGSSEPIDEPLLARMISTIRHRGPDESGMYVDSTVGLAHARLSIIGLTGGTQPICNEDGTLWIVYNGEAFNYVELREELLGRGHVFRTTTDTEVLLHLYEEHGVESLKRINGQFALAIWDSRKRELFLARDRLGIRPLFYTRSRGRLLFGSEIKALFADPSVPRAIDPVALAETFTFWSTQAPRTAFRDVHALRPGHTLVARGAEITETPYWRIPLVTPDAYYGGTFEQARDELRALLKDAVRIRLRADVPVGAYLSGGLDSSLVTALIARHFDNDLRTFSMSFEEAPFDETPFQQTMTRQLGTRHSQVHIGNDQIRELLPEVVWHCETPLTRTAPVPLLLLSRLVRDHGFKVVLTGEGADEVFGGYNIFREAKVRRFWARRPNSTLRPLLLERLYPYVFRDPARTRFFLQKFYAVRDGDLDDPLFSHQVRWRNSARNRTFFSDEVRAALAGHDPVEELRCRLPESFGSRDALSRAQVLEMELFLSSYLLSSQGDRVAMASSLETRMPFLDYRVVELGFRLPPRWKINALKEKHILKEAARGVLPEEVRGRAKKPYRAPIREALAGRGGDDWVHDLLSAPRLRRAGYFDERKVAHLLARCEDGSGTGETQDMALVGILTTQLLHHQFVESAALSDSDGRTLDRVVRVA
ncbi:MAG: asparagine synthase (glutamine-hydrolyzing) [Candidatus Eiseniibacteriota bacterium]